MIICGVWHLIIGLIAVKIDNTEGIRMKDINNNSSLFRLVKYIMWGEKPFKIDDNVYFEMKSHAIIALPANVVKKLGLSKSIQDSWEKDIYAQIAYNVKCINVQNSLPLKVPYVILKGTSAAKYYPYPRYRTMGDIDIMTRHEDYEATCKMLLEGGFSEKSSVHMNEFGRHRSFSKNGVFVEVHSFFSLLNDIDQAKYLDNLIIDNINDSHLLPDLVNGLVILEHISQHLEFGIGLRHVIDWMMFADKCLQNDNWTEFQKMAQNIGLEPLAVVLTRMCELYLGLPEKEWCRNVNEKTCDQLMDYIMSCGNFGIKRKTDEDVVTNALVYARTPLSTLRLLQERGLVNWKACRKYSVLRPFAWVYQLIRYLISGLMQRDAVPKLKKEFNIASQRKKLFDELGVKQASKGHAVYRDEGYSMTFERP